MARKKWSLWYGWANVWVYFALKVYFRKIEITGLEKIPKNKPVLLGLNHQNAFLDAIAVAALFPSQPYFLVRSDVFKSPIARSFFGSIRMMPIYRDRDGVNTVDYNKPVFEKCYSILGKNGQIILFPEGSHDKHKVLRPLKKGVSRIAFGAEEAYNFELDVHLVPVGLNYSQYNKFGGTLHINVGEALPVSKYIDAYKDHANKGNAALTKELHTALSATMVDYGSIEFHDAMEFLRLMFPAYMHNRAGLNADSLANDTQAARYFIAQFNLWRETNPTEAHQLKEMALALKKMLRELKLHPIILSDAGRKDITLTDRLALVFGAPVFALGAILHYLPFTYPKRFCDKKIKDPVFHSSLKMAFGLLGISATYLIYFVLGFLFLPLEQALIFIFLVPLSGWLSLKYYYLLRQTLGRITWKNLCSNKPKKAADVFHLIDEVKRIITQFA